MNKDPHVGVCPRCHDYILIGEIPHKPETCWAVLVERLHEAAHICEEWGTAYSKRYDKLKEFEAMKHKILPSDLEDKLKALKISSPVAGRKASQDTLNLIADYLPQLYGGSADLSS